MLNESRIKLMTRMASYEKEEGKRNMRIGTYFRGDYIAKEVMKSIVYGTIAYGIMVGMYLAYDFEVLMEEIYSMDLLTFGKAVLERYLILIAVYSVITYIVYALRHRAARRKLRIYYNNLRRLSSMYKKEESESGDTEPVSKKERTK
jgi:ABC-type multidrug transport system permease subunit